MNPMMRSARMPTKGLALICAAILSILSFAVPAEGQAGGGIGLGAIGGPDRLSRESFDTDLVIVVLQPTDKMVSPKEISLPTQSDPSAGKPSTFRVVKVLKGVERIKAGDFVEVVPSETLNPKHPPHAWLGRYDVPEDQKTGSWLEAVPLSATLEAYAEMLATKMPSQKRVLEYYRFWSTDDEEVRDGASCVLSSLDLPDLLPLRKHLDHDLIVRRAQDRKLDFGSRVLAFNLLAIAGTAKDKEWLQAYIQRLPGADEKEYRADDCPTEAIFAYLALAGKDGMRWLENGILKDSHARRHADAIDALIRHANSGKFISRDLALRGLHTALDAPKPDVSLIDQLRDLKDWSAVDRVAQIGVEAAGGKHASFAVLWAALKYLFDCPRPEAKAHLAEIKQLVPEIYANCDQAYNTK